MFWFQDRAGYYSMYIGFNLEISSRGQNNKVINNGGWAVARGPLNETLYMQNNKVKNNGGWGGQWLEGP